MFFIRSTIIIGFLAYLTGIPQISFYPTILPYNPGYYFIPYPFLQNPVLQHHRGTPFLPHLYPRHIPFMPFFVHSQNHLPELFQHISENRPNQFSPDINAFNYPGPRPSPTDYSRTYVSPDGHRIEYIITPPEVPGLSSSFFPEKADQKQVIGFIPEHNIVRSVPVSRHVPQLFPDNNLGNYVFPRLPSIYAAMRSTSKCGIRKKTVKVDKNIDQTSDAIVVESATEEIERARTSDSTLPSLEWGGPDLSKTIFFEKGGITPFLVPKITFGEVAARYEAPWQVAIFNKKKFHCGASIIGEKHILTAAHCVVQFVHNPSLLRIVIGDWDLRSQEDGVGVEVIPEKIFSHPRFSYYTLQNDIAVIKVKNKIIFSDNIQSICLPTSDTQTSDLITITGWGRNENNRLQTKLQKIEAAVVSHLQCSVKWSNKGVSSNLIGTKTLCMNTQYGDSCKGDSGGPAWKEYPPTSGSFIQVGIVSFGSGSCTDINLPGVYTKVAAYLSWIEEKMLL